MAKEIKNEAKANAQAIKSGRIKSKVNYDVTVKYEDRDCIVAPRQVLKIADFSKLSSYSPNEILVFMD